MGLARMEIPVDGVGTNVSAAHGAPRMEISAHGAPRMGFTGELAGELVIYILYECYAFHSIQNKVFETLSFTIF